MSNANAIKGNIVHALIEDSRKLNSYVSLFSMGEGIVTASIHVPVIKHNDQHLALVGGKSMCVWPAEDCPDVKTEDEFVYTGD